MGFAVFLLCMFVCVVNERWVVAYNAFIYGKLEGFFWGCGESTVNSCQLADMRLRLSRFYPKKSKIKN